MLVLLVVLAFPLYATAAGADDTVTFTGTQVIPVPPASSYAGSGGGDGWGVALSNTAVYNVFHHLSNLNVACHLQVDASPCWTNSDHNQIASRVITDANGNDFATPGHPGVYLDQRSGHLFTFAMRTSDRTGGVVCIDTTGSSPDPGPYFCGFTPLTGPRESTTGGFGVADISDVAVVGSRLFAYNFFSGVGSTNGEEDSENSLLCFDLSTSAACNGQPFGVEIGDGTVSASDYPPPAVAAIGSKVIVPITVGQTQELACFDGSSLNDCAGSWPVAIQSGYVSAAGAPFPLLSSNGTLTGLCLPYSSDPCFDLSGGSVATPAGMAQAIPQTSGWNGPAVVVGPRVYVPNGNYNQVDCYDYAQSAGCSGFPKSFTNPYLSLLYTVNADPQRPTCLWVNADTGTQIQNFDAFSGGGCGQGPIRVLASSFVVNAPRCTPGNYSSLQVTSPAPGSYTSGSVTFADPSGNAIPGASEVPLDGTGTAQLSGLSLNTSAGLPQFLITLNGTGAPSQVVVKLTWIGTFDPTCAQGNTTIVNPPAGTQPTGTPTASDLAVTVGGPAYVRAGQNASFTAQVANRGIRVSTGVVLKLGIPAGSTFVSATIDHGSCTSGATGVSCIVGTLGPAATANATLVVKSAKPGSLTMPASAVGDYDSNPSNNNGSATTAVLDPSAPPPPPPAPTQPGTYNAITVGTVTVNGVALPPDQLFVFHTGDVIDVTNGSITFTSVGGDFGTFSGAQPQAARRISGVGRLVAGSGPLAQFTVAPTPAGGPTTLMLSGGDFSTCTSPRKLDAKKKTVVRQLWGKASGHFRTQARYSSATIRGTVWLTEDRCDGSYTQAVVDSVDVNDFVKNTTVTLSPGQTYLAQPKAAFKPPKQVKHKKAKAKKHAKPKPLTYVVQNGDSLSSIATQQLGVEHRWVEIAKLNGLKPPYAVQPGTTIKLPKR